MAPAASGGRSQSRGLARPPDRHPADKRREFDDAIGSRPGGLAVAAGPNPVGRLVPGHHVADAGDAAVGVADHGQPFNRERRPGAIPQEMLKRLKIARHVAVEEGDPHRLGGWPAA